MKLAIAILALALAAAPFSAQAGTVTCSTFAGVRTCIGPGGYVSRESQWQGLTTGDDSAGNRWTQWDRQGQTFTTVTPSREASPMPR